MITTDPARTPTFTQFANPDYFLETGAATCDPTDAGAKPCTTLEGHSGFAWNHGDVNPDINTTWLGMVGPGVRHLGIVSPSGANSGADARGLWSDHTDIRPTMMALLGLHDDYSHDGRVLFEVLADSALPQSLRAHRDTLTRLAQVYKQIDAPVGALGLASLHISSVALESNAPSDATYTQLEKELAWVTTQRNTIAAQMSSMLENAAFNGQAIDEQQAKKLIDQGQNLLEQVNTMAAAAH
jgi:hypothetical protein